MIRFENGTIAFDHGDTVADIRTWLQEQAASGNWHALSVTIATDKDIWLLKRMAISENYGFEVHEHGIGCDRFEIRQLTANPSGQSGYMGVYACVKEPTED